MRPVWGLSRKVSRSLATALLAVPLLFAACSEDGSGGGPTASTREQADYTEGTLAPPTTVVRRTEDTTPPEGTLKKEPGESGDVVIRLEGAAETRFSGICTVGEEEKIISGQVPKRFVFDLEGRSLSCRIQKQDSGGGLKVVLVVDDSIRSVQQTSAREGTIDLSYGGD
jgi:hypothetical protein